MIKYIRNLKTQWKMKETNPVKYKSLENEIKIPILRQNNKFLQCSDDIEKIFIHVQGKIFHDGKLNVNNLCQISCPLETIIINYIYSFMNDPFIPDNIKEILKIVYYWKSQFVPDEKHLDCKCNELFKNATNEKSKNKQTKKQLKFYEYISSINSRFDNFVTSQKIKNKSYNVSNDNDYSYLPKTDYMPIHDKSFLDFSNTNEEDEHYIIEIEQDLNILGFDKLMLKLLFKYLHINRTRHFEVNKLDNITFIIFSLNIEPLYVKFQFNDDEAKYLYNLFNSLIIEKAKEYAKIFVEYVCTQSESNNITDNSEYMKVLFEKERDDDDKYNNDTMAKIYYKLKEISENKEINESMLYSNISPYLNRFFNKQYMFNRTFKEMLHNENNIQEAMIKCMYKYIDDDFK